MKKFIVAALLWIAFMSSACSTAIQPRSDVVPTMSFTTVPVVVSQVAPTSTLLSPIQTPDVVAGMVPEGKPASEWKGIPIMAGAIAGEGDEEGYVFTIKATPQQVQEYYRLELGKLGWQPFATGDGDLSRMLMFMDSASATLTLSIIAKGEDVLVLLVK